MLDEKERKLAEFSPSASITKSLNEDKSAIALIPSSEIITNKKLFISKKTGISFEGTISNSYIYYSSEGKKVKELKVYGDISTLEIIFSKILFKELYASEIEISISTEIANLKNGNFILCGDENFINAGFKNGISFAEEMVDLISAPFVNYVFASYNKDSLAEFADELYGKFSGVDLFDVYLPEEFPAESKEFIRSNISKIFYQLDDQDIEGINQLTRLPYYHGLINEIIEVKFV